MFPTPDVFQNKKQKGQNICLLWYFSHCVSCCGSGE